VGLRGYEPHPYGAAGQRKRKLSLLSERSRGRRASDRRPLFPPADAAGAAADQRALLSLRQSRLFAHSPSPETITVYSDRVEYARPGLVARRRTVTIRYEQVSQVTLDRRLIWSALAVETTGGGGFVIDGVRRPDADAAKTKLDQLIAGVHARESVAEALERLSRLRENGLLTDFEYAAAKGAVFRSAA